MEQRLVELHIKAARERALRIFAFSSATYPIEWQKSYSEILVVDLQEFAFHARRVNQLCGYNEFQFNPIDAMIFKLSDGNPEDWEKNYQHALNRLVHIVSFAIGNAHTDHRRIFLSSEANVALIYVRVRTDRFEYRTISLFGLVNCFLSEVLSKLKMDFPQLSF